MKYLTAIIAIIMFSLMNVPALGQAQLAPWLKQAVICPASDGDVSPPDFTSPNCTSVPFYQIDPQGRHIWVKVVATLPPDIIDQTPLSLFISVKGSSVVYLNGRKFIENGVPADEKSREISGKMDISIPIPDALIKAGDNQIVLRMSSHRGYLKLSAPVHRIAISKSLNVQDSMLRSYWPTLLPFGALILGGLYFVVMATRGRQPGPAALLSTMAFAAAAQLFIEVSRGLFAYAYPVQDLRLIGIWACAAIFGLSLATFILHRFQYFRKFWFIGIAFGLVALSLMAGGMDTKASLAFLLPAIYAAGLCLYKGVKGDKSAWGFAAALILFAGLNVFTSGQFLDLYFYYVVLALLLFLFAQQAVAFTREQDLLIIEGERSERLQIALDKKRAETEGVSLNITSAGHIRPINTRQIVHIDGAGDYTDIVMETGKTYLHSQTLAELEAALPPQFLRVHRSHIVNTDFVESLSRESSGTGSLSLTNGDLVPVSRRIMPGVRKALN